MTDTTPVICPACFQAVPGAGASPYDLVSFPPLDAEAFAHLATDIARRAPLAGPVAVLEEALLSAAAGGALGYLAGRKP